MKQVDMGYIGGPQGKQGRTGPRGKAGEDGVSAYSAAVSAGYDGDESGFYNKLKMIPDTKEGPAGWCIVRTETGTDWGRLP